MLRKIYSCESEIKEVCGKVKSVSLSGKVHIGDNVLHCRSPTIIMILRHAKRLSHGVRLLIHREQGHFLGRRFDSSTIVKLLGVMEC